MTRAEAITAALSAFSSAAGTTGATTVLWVEVEPIEALDAARGANRSSADGMPAGAFDAAVIGPLASDLATVVAAARERIREGGMVAAVVPVERDGVRGATQRALATFDAKRRPRALEDACAAVLCAGVPRVKVIEISGARGECVVHGVLAAD